MSVTPSGRVDRVEVALGQLDQLAARAAACLGVAAPAGHHARAGPGRAKSAGVGVELAPARPGRTRWGRSASSRASAESSPTSSRCSISMPNGVPQSPMWFCRTTVVAEVLQHPGQRVADDGGAQVADVHLLGDVGGGVVDRDDLPRSCTGTPRRASAAERGDPRREPVVAQRQVDEAGPADLDVAGRRRRRRRCSTIRPATSRGRQPEPLGQGERRVGLEVGECDDGRTTGSRWACSGPNAAPMAAWTCSARTVAGRPSAEPTDAGTPHRPH